MTCFTQADKSVVVQAYMDKMKPLVDNMGAKNFLGGADPCIADFILFEMIEFAQKVSGNAVFGTHPTM